MAITKKQCAWHECEKEFWGTKRKEYCGNTCKNKQWRLNQKAVSKQTKKESVND